MKKSIKILVLFFISCFFYSNAQVRVGGGVSIDIDIPDVVIGTRKRNPRPVPRPVPQPVPQPVPVPVPAPRPAPRVYTFGNIDNLNRPDGNHSFQVVNAFIKNGRNQTESVFYELNNGETLELIIGTANPNDYNYNYYQRGHGHHHNANNNQILAVYLNNTELPLQSGHIAVTPNGYGYQSVINIHSFYEGSFHGTINF